MCSALLPSCWCWPILQFNTFELLCSRSSCWLILQFNTFWVVLFSKFGVGRYHCPPVSALFWTYLACVRLFACGRLLGMCGVLASLAFWCASGLQILICYVFMFSLVSFWEVPDSKYQALASTVICFACFHEVSFFFNVWSHFGGILAPKLATILLFSLSAKLWRTMENIAI